MRILSKYVVTEFAKFLGIFETIFVFIFLVVDFFDKIDNFMAAKVSEQVIFLYFLYKMPFMIVNMIPPTVAITVIMVFSAMKKNHEITAMKACGINLFRISQVLVVAAAVVAIFTFLTSEVVVPYASSKSNDIYKKEVQKQDPGLFYGSNQIWYKGADWIYWIRHFDSKSQVMEDPVFYFFDKSFRLVRKVEAARGIWENGRWKVEDAMVQELGEAGNYRVSRVGSLFLDIPEKPESFVKGLKKPEEMGYWQLKRYAEGVREEGYDNSKYLVDANIKVAFPFICLVLVVTSVPIALGLKKGGAALGVTIGVATCFLYVMILGFSRSLGLAGVLPPLLSAWLPNLAFSLLGIYWMLHVER